MGSRRVHDSSEASIDESDPNYVRSTEESASGVSRRSYECVFCKRGFTNAQALGGHMNIHRKDRARSSKQVVAAGPSHSIPNVSYTEPPKHYPAWDHSSIQGRYYSDSLHVPTWGFSQYSGDSTLDNCLGYNQNTPRPGYPGNDYQVSSANFSLRVELSNVENYEMRGTKEDDEIDLELRLGYYGSSSI